MKQRIFLKHKLIILVMALAVFFTLPFSSASARGFSGGHVSHFSGSTHTTRSFNSYHAPSTTYKAPTKTYKSPSSTYKAPTKSYNSNSNKSSSTTKTYRVNRNNSGTTHNTYNTYNSSNYNNRRSGGLGTMFGHSIIRGAGWSIGSNMGNSIWHQSFGFGGNQYYDNQGRVQYSQPGYGGFFLILFLIILVIAIIFVVSKLKNKSKNSYY